MPTTSHEPIPARRNHIGSDEKDLSTSDFEMVAGFRRAASSVPGERLGEPGARKSRSGVREMTCEVRRHLSRIVFDAMDEGRFPPPQDRQAERVETGSVSDDAAVVAEQAPSVEYRDVQPGVVGAVTGRPDDGADLTAAQVELQPRRGCELDRCEPL